MFNFYDIKQRVILVVDGEWSESLTTEKGFESIKKMAEFLEANNQRNNVASCSKPEIYDAYVYSRTVLIYKVRAKVIFGLKIWSDFY